MKPITLLAVLFLLNTAVKISAQTVSIQTNGKEIQLSNDTTAKLVSFTGRSNSEKVYLHWQVINLHEDGVFLVYRSVDGVNYENIGSKQSIGVPISKAMGYYFTDENPGEGTMYYKLIHVAKSSSYIMSDRITVPSQCLFLVGNR